MNKSLALKIVALCFICSFLTGIAVYASSPSLIQTISSGVVPGAPSYTVYEVDGTYYAKDQNGVNEFSGADAATVINNAIESAYNANGGIVFLSAGTYYLDSTVIVEPFVSLEGEGYGTWTGGLGSRDGATVLYANDGFEGHIIQLHDTPYGSSVKNLRVYGNADNVDSWESSGISIQHSAYFVDTAILVENVFIEACDGFGISATGDIREVRMNNVLVYGCRRNGFYLAGGDHKLVNCVAGNNGYHGFIVVEGGNIQFSNCKSFGSGQLDVFAQGDGFYIANGAFGCIFTSCVAQDNQRHGFSFYNTTGNVMSGCHSQDNGWSDSGDGFGISLDTAENNTITGCYAGYFGSYYQEYGVVLAASADYNNICVCTAMGNIEYDIVDAGSNNEIHSCFNGTSWIT